MPTAVLVDGGFFLKRFNALSTNPQKTDPRYVANALHVMARKHLDLGHGHFDLLYRIFFYDCKPFAGKAHNPISNKVVDFSKDPISIFRNGFHKELKKLRKVALRLGYLQGYKTWNIGGIETRELLKGKMKLEDLKENQVFYKLTQKSVDIKIGIDIASLAYKQHVNRIVLVSGDGDFVPAAKLARREGIDFILDPMWATIDESLFEHIDGLKTVFFKNEKNNGK